MSKLRVMIGIIAIALLIAAPASATLMTLSADSSWSFAYTGPGTITLAASTNSAHISGLLMHRPKRQVLSRIQPLGGASVLVNSLPHLLHQEANNH